MRNVLYMECGVLRTRKKLNALRTEERFWYPSNDILKNYLYESKVHEGAGIVLRAETACCMSSQQDDIV
jgi:hypothetical protein